MARLPVPPWTPQQTLQWLGTLNDPSEPVRQRTFTTLAGPGGPVPTGGWAQISNIARPRRISFTEVTGYDPLAMDVPIRFDMTVPYAGLPDDAEAQIQVLEWMAGRGKLYTKASGDHPAQGDPPIIQVTSYDQGNQPTNLIPPNFQSDGAQDVRWLISNLSYDTNPIRDSTGSRIFQDVTVSLTQYVAAPGAPTSVSERQQQRGNPKVITVVSKQGMDTIMKMCQANGYKQESQWNIVVWDNLATLKVRSYTQKLKYGTKVQIPANVGQ